MSDPPVNDESRLPGDSTETYRDSQGRLSQIGPYNLLRVLGEGGMGIVYEAEQVNPRRLVALKVIRGARHSDEGAVRLFQREIHALARLRHPSIAAIYESGRTDDGQHYFAMELVRAPTLREWLGARSTEGAVPQDEIKFRLRVLRKICDAVAYAHQRGVIHRDLKPGNIMIQPASAVASVGGESVLPEIKVLDFGLARITDADVTATSATLEVGKIAGTLPYMSPEQVRGNPDEIDFRSDVYALGVILYEMLTGQLPYELNRAAIHEMVRVICEQQPRPLADSWIGARRPDSDIKTIVHRILEKEPARRYQTVASFAEDIDRYLTDQPILAHPPSALYTIQKLIRRHRAEFAVTIGIAAIVVGFTIALAVQSHRVSVERDRALMEAKRVKIEADGFYAAFRGDYPTAAALLREALRLHEEALGSDSPDLVPHIYTLGGYLSLFDEGGILDSTRKAEGEVESLYRDALRIRRHAFPPDHPLVIESSLVLADFFLNSASKANIAAAESIYRVVADERARFGDSDSLRQKSLQGLARALKEAESH